MQLITEMDLPILPVEEPRFFSNPMPFVNEARQKHPWAAKFSQGYFIHGHQAAKDLGLRDDSMTPGHGHLVEFYDAKETLWGEFMENFIYSDSEHARRRAAIAAAFTPRSANAIRPLIQGVISEILDEWVPRGKFDFVEFASCYPIAVMCGMLGIPTANVLQLRDAIEVQTSSLAFIRDLRSEVLAGFDVICDLVDSAVVKHKRGAGGDESLIGALLAAKDKGHIDDREVRFWIILLLLGGFDTSRNQLSVTMFILLSRPEMWARCGEDKAYCRKVIEEVLRYASIASWPRTITKDIDYDGVRLPKGIFLLFGAPVAGQDPAAFNESATFNPDRIEKNRHIAFGLGAHHCLGQFIARNLLEEGLHNIAKRIKSPRLDGEVIWRTFIGAWGLQKLPIAF